MTYNHKQSIEIESYIYKMGKAKADEIKDLVSVIIDRTDNNSENKTAENNIKPVNSIADEILKLNELKEKGILTIEEYLIQKNKLLNKR